MRVQVLDVHNFIFWNVVRVTDTAAIALLSLAAVEEEE